MAYLVSGPRTISLAVDDRGYRDYKVVFLVRTDNPYDLAYSVLRAPGLPLVGSALNLGNDFDIWAWRKHETEVKPHMEREGDTTYNWRVEMVFSTKASRWCVDHPFEDPLLDVYELKINSVHKQEQAAKDRFGSPIRNSAFEQIRGHVVEFHTSAGKVRIEQNVLLPQVALLETMRNKVNALPMWGMLPRCVRLADYDLDRKYHGSCYVYYKRTLEFELDSRTFDRDIADEGSRVLNGRWATSDDVAAGFLPRTWVLLDVEFDLPLADDPEAVGQTPPDPLNPAHFILFPDSHGNPTHAPLDGHGKPFVRPLPVIECAECPARDYSPATWILDGLGQQYELVWFDGCSWAYQQAPDETFTIQLTFSGGTWKITYTPDVVGDPDTRWVWTLISGPFDCNGPNVFFLIEGTVPPATFTVSIHPDEGGKIHVEYYNEADFFILGIPLVLE